jgi:Mrp family chromosome partitioning ATPase
MNMLGSIADLMIFVVRAGVTPQDLTQRAIKMMRPPERSGVILTGYDGGADSRYLSQCYTQGYGRYVG